MFLLALAVPAASQSEKRREQIEGLIKRSDLVIVGVSQAYYPIINLVKYNQERLERGVINPGRRSKYTFGTIYKMTVREALYQEPPKRKDTPRPAFAANDTVMIYVTGPGAHPLDLNKAAFLPGAEYIVFLKKTGLDEGDFPHGKQQDLNAPMAEWESFPNPTEMYFQVVNDPMAAKLVDDVWQKLVDDTRVVSRQMKAREQ
jgi:hypothetical protein